MRRFVKHAPSQRELMRVLRLSPLPWTADMLHSWLGYKWDGSHVGNPITEAVALRRIWRCGPGLFTSIDRRCPLKRIVTDDMLARYGFNL